MLFPETDKKCNFCKTLWCLPAMTPERRAMEESEFTLNEYLDTMMDIKNDFFKIPESK